MKKFIGRKTNFSYVVEVEGEGFVRLLSLAKSLQVVDHSPEGFQWGHSGKGASQLSAAILYEGTGDADIARQYYQIFLSDCVEKWGDTFEINEFQVRRWLRNKGAEKYMVDMANIINRATADFEEFHSLCIRVKRISTTEQEQQVIEMIQLCESAILRGDAWVQEYKRYILELVPAEYRTPSEGYKWMPMLEGIRDELSFLRDLLYDQQLDYTRLEVVEKIRREVMELLSEHIYFRIF